MKALALFLLFLSLFSYQVLHAELYRHDCLQKNCLLYGWNTFDKSGNLLSHTKCNEDNCTQKGWKTFDKENILTEHVDCQQGGCFSQGQIIQKGGTTFYLNCTNNNCLKYGWNLTDNVNFYQRYFCTTLDCQNKGWSSVDNKHFVICKAITPTDSPSSLGLCFTSSQEEITRD